MEEGYIKVAYVRQLREGQGLTVQFDGDDVALFRIGEEIHAIDNLCPHQHIPVLAEGQLEATILTCPMHGWQFDITTGLCTHGSGRLRRYLVKVEAGSVYLAHPEDEAPSW